jgi:sec-independent protein translocase protein TatB
MPFDIGFIELCIILVVSLIVLGPDKLPTAARALSRIFRTVTRTVNSFKHEVGRELQMDELKQQLEEQNKRLARVANQANNFDLNSIVSSDATQTDSPKPNQSNQPNHDNR